MRIPALLVTGSAALYALVVFLPPTGSAVIDTYHPDKNVQEPAFPPSTTSVPFGGVAAVGALFTLHGSQLDRHFCTASVVHSAHGDLAMTAAHCLLTVHGPIAFVPGYANGETPYGVWPVTGVYTDQAWQSGHSQDDDFAFLRLAKEHGGPVEDLTGAETLGTGLQTAPVVEGAASPDGETAPIECASPATLFDGGTQLQFGCDDFIDGTSGGPFLTQVDARTGQGTVVGVIGGYQQGGDYPSVSYAAQITSATVALLHSAEAAG